MEYFNMVCSLISGLALFLYGMDTLSGALSQMTGGGLEEKIGKATSNKYKGFLMGTVITAIAQSSSVTTVLTVGLVNAGIMKLADSVGLIIGANLGTTATAWLLSLNALPGGTLLLTLCKPKPSTFTPFLALIGVILLMAAKSNPKKTLGTCLIGFSVMMIGMSMMSAAMSPLKDVPAFHNMLVSFANPFLGYLAGLLFTMLIQSSDATIGILEAIAISMPISYGTVIPLICGAQCGSCISALMSSMGTCNNGKRTALIHLYYNLFKTIPFLIIFYTLNMIFHFPFLDVSAGATGIPIFHSAINIVAAIIYLPVCGIFVKLAEKTIPYNEKERQEQESKLKGLDPLFLSNPQFAITQVREALNIMAQNAGDAYGSLVDQVDRETFDVYYDRNRKYTEQILKYLTSLSSKQIDADIASKIRYEQQACDAWDRIVNMTANIFDLQEKAMEAGVGFSPEERTDVHVVAESVREIVDVTVIDFDREIDSLGNVINISKDIITQFQWIIFKKHMANLQGETSSQRISSLFIDLIYSFEKIIDACDEVASGMAEYHQEFGLGNPDEKEIRPEVVRALFEDKYELLVGSSSDLLSSPRP